MACKNYAQRISLDLPSFDMNVYGQRNLIEDVLCHVSEAIVMDEDVKDWNLVLKTIENYFIVLDKRELNITEYLGKFIHEVRGDKDVLNLKKI